MQPIENMEWGWPATLLCADTSDLEIRATTRIPWTADTLWSHLDPSRVAFTPRRLARNACQAGVQVDCQLEQVNGDG